MIVANLFPKKNNFFPKNFIVIVNHSNFANYFPKKYFYFPKRLYTLKKKTMTPYSRFFKWRMNTPFYTPIQNLRTRL